jgi:uncharacterized Rmd1/YagE family protein
MQGGSVITRGSRRIDWVLILLLAVSVCITCLSVLGVAFLVALA